MGGSLSGTEIDRGGGQGTGCMAAGWAVAGHLIWKNKALLQHVFDERGGQGAGHESYQGWSINVRICVESGHLP
jgi:hypothetical protein